MSGLVFTSSAEARQPDWVRQQKSEKRLAKQRWHAARQGGCSVNNYPYFCGSSNGNQYGFGNPYNYGYPNNLSLWQRFRQGF
jgi:hypothetical protein